jgi:hypothetical protein
MITLKPNCSALSFKNMEKTKENFTLLMYGTVEKEIIDQEIQRNKEIVESENDSAGYFQAQVDYLNKLKLCPHYQNGSLPRGIEKIILQVMESYTFWHSLNEVESNFFLTQNNYIHNLINVSVTFMVSCELAKLFNNKPDDFSLCNIWNHDVHEIKKSNVTTIDEIDYITEQFARNESTRDKAIKRFLDFRNKSIAHNENNIGMKWSDFFSAMNFIIRVWGIIDEYYNPGCFPRPIQLSNQVYTPLQPYFSHQQIDAMRAARLKLMTDMFLSASTNLKTGAKDNIKPFGDLQISVKVNMG